MKYDYITVRDLYGFAMTHKLLDARVRICDGMAVSYYPAPQSVGRGMYEIVIDVSGDEPVEFDEYAQHYDAVSTDHPTR
ncbi:MAG: hypothetical protein NC250_01820 [Alistipes senegalensis]|nr:hypothetical protein [Bacteroides cellulosilyticus]MCM1351455.1 hypothetical protein [Alistipes senegalensis]